MIDSAEAIFVLLIVSYAALSGLFLLNWRGNVSGGFLVLAGLVALIWSGTVLASLLSEVPEVLLYVTEVARLGVWTMPLALLLKKVGGRTLLQLLAFGGWAVVLLLGFVEIRYGKLGLQSVRGAGCLAVSLIGLFLLEQLYRNSPQDAGRAIKPLMIGLGGIFVCDIFVFSQALLLGADHPVGSALRGGVNLVTVPFLIVAARRNPNWELDIFVSRQFVFYTTTLFAVGLYLILTSAISFWLFKQQGTWTSFPQIAFLFGSAFVLVLLLLSSALRARLKVFLSKHFFRNKYDYRQEWLRLIATMGEFEGSSTRQIVIQALAQIVNSPRGFLWILNDQEEVYEYSASLNSDQWCPDLPVSDPIVDFVARREWLIDLEEFRDNPKLYAGLNLPAWVEGFRDPWLIVPLFSKQELFGLALLSKAPGSLKLNYEDRDLLKTVGNHIAVHLAQERSDKRLAEVRQFEAYNQLTAFLMHDLNNLVAQLSLVVANAERHKRNPDFVDDAMRTIANSVDRMRRVMDQLKRGDSSPATKSTLLKFVVSNAVDRCASGKPAPSLNLDDNDATVTVDADRLTMVITHLIRNAQDATDADGWIKVSTTSNAQSVSVVVEDNGPGMTKEFIRDSLFKPFYSTKGTQGMGIGAYQAREFARATGGSLHVESAIGEGTRVVLKLPLIN
jgi:putative PEP-CTERM system histidine kinase